MLKMSKLPILMLCAALTSAAQAEPYSLKPVIPPLKLIHDDTALFEDVIKCYPAPSLFDLEVKFTAGYRKQNASDYYEQAGGWKDNAYAGLIVEVPLYSTQERYRALHEESKRREMLAKEIANLNKAIALKIKSEDLYQLYKALEVRSSVRVKDGYTPLDEQVRFIEKGAAAYEDFMNAQSQINNSIMNIAAYCTTDKREAIIKRLREHVKRGGSLHSLNYKPRKVDNFTKPGEKKSK